MNRAVGFAGVFLGIIFCLQAAAGVPDAYIDMEPGFFQGPPKVVIDGKDLHRGFLFLGYDGLAKAVRENSTALEYAQKHEKYAQWAGIAIWGGVGASLAYLAIAEPGNVSSSLDWGIFSAGLITGIFFERRATAYLFKAINSYNGVDPSKTSEVGLSITPMTSGAALSLSYNF